MIGHGSGTAVDALSAAVSAEPGRADLWSELATALVAAGRAPEAWDAAVRAVELAPRSAASHRAIGAVAAALGDSAQAEAAYRNASLLDPGSSAGVPSPGGGRHAWDRATPPSGGGRRRAPEAARTAQWPVERTPSTGGRRRAREDGAATALWPGAEPVGDGVLATSVWGAPPPGGEAALPRAAGSAAETQRTAVGLPGWLGPVGPTTGPDGWTRGGSAPPVADPAAWRRGLIAVVRIEWLVGVVCFLGLAYARTAPYAAGLLAGALIIGGAYGRRRWRTARRPPGSERVATYAAVAAAATAVVIIPAALAGALTLARGAAVAAVTWATVAAVLLARTGRRTRTPR